MTARCSSCGASIVWTRTTKGKAMPVDAEPTARVLVLDDDAGGTPIARSVLAYVSHFATCPDAARHRRNGERRSA